MTTPLLHARNLAVSYGDRRVSWVPELTVMPGECVAIVGESGSGKTSALLALLGLQPGARVDGKVDMLGEQDVLAHPRARASLLGSRIALVSQSPISALNPTMKLGRFAGLALRKHGRSKAEANAAIEAALLAVSLDEELLDRYPHQISGGQAQRFAIALALALGVELLVADEPTSALDVTVQAEVVALLDELRRTRGVGMLIVSHDIALVSGISDRIVVMKDGVVVESGPTREVILSPKSDFARELIGVVEHVKGDQS